ncbi:MAG: hypothetical protein J5848_06765 [Bacteroidales bacterium]|nr:hypothetical protein [Bacteroidales bacterium]
MSTIMYIHGYGSNGNAIKGQSLRRMFPLHRVVSPTFDYDNRSPWEIQEQIRKTVASEEVKMIVGSSFGGYQTLCATAFFHGPVWAINPVHDVVNTIHRIFGNDISDVYFDFDSKVFRHQSKLNCNGEWPDDTPLNFALSTDDELLGDHHPLLELFPKHQSVVWKDRCGHRFYRFEELRDDIAATL